MIWFILGFLAYPALKHVETVLFFIPGYCKFMYNHKPKHMYGIVNSQGRIRSLPCCIRCGKVFDRSA